MCRAHGYPFHWTLTSSKALIVSKGSFKHNNAAVLKLEMEQRFFVLRL